MNLPYSPTRPATPGEAGLSRPLRAQPAAAIRVMIVDDSLTVRTVFKRMVESEPGMCITGTASSAERAIAQLKSEPVDVVLLDLEMPGIGGLEALPAILATAEHTQVLVVSSLTIDGAEHTLAALSMGAADTMLKPRPGGFTEEYRTQLLAKIRALGTRLVDPGVGARATTAVPSRPGAGSRARRPEVLAIGASTGGIHALGLLLRTLGPEFDLPILVTQHLPPSFIPVFARQMEVACGRPADIAEDGTAILPGRIAIATGRGHMLVRRQNDRLVARVSAEPAASGCLPSVDPMLSSLAHACEGRVLAVILSGMGRDGLEGATELAAAGGTIFAQDAATSAVWGMPGAVTKAGLASLVDSPERLGKAVLAEAGVRVSR